MLTHHATPVIAIATAPGRGAVGIVRLSGRGLQAYAQRLCRQPLAARVATYLPLRDLHDQVIDRGLALFFPAPHSYTGEDVLELQVHGGPAVLQLLVAHCLALAAQPDGVGGGEGQNRPGGPALLPGLRLARPGEFTERAFLNGKLDLAQAEAVADLIDASTEAAVRSASRSLSGVFSHEVQALRDGLVNLRMLVEATLDFPEEEIDFLTQADAAGKLARLREALTALQQRTRQGALLREGIKVVIAGQPNAGKSSLLNALAGAELAIVTPIAGTTRDKVGQTIQIEGVPLHIVDTAGLRDSDDTVERIGIERAWDEIASADVVLFLHDLARQGEPAYTAEDTRIAQRLPAGVPRIDLWNKSDLADTTPITATAASDDGASLHLSAKTGAGLEALRRHLLETVGWQSADEGIFMARERHVQALAAVA
ncbi:MAG: tRNA modification GTPase, partial [Comamonas sp.]